MINKFGDNLLFCLTNTKRRFKYLALIVEKLKIDLKQHNFMQPLILPLSFELNPNKVYSIVGKNGGGKTTLIKSLTCLNDEAVFAAEGAVWFNNINLIKAESKTLRQMRKEKIKYVFQDSISSFDPLRKVKYYFQPFIKRAEFDELMRYFLFENLIDVLQLYPYELSGGMAQRLSFILAFLYNPDILILDEPTSALDYRIINLLLHSIKEFAKKKNNVALIVTHDFHFARAVSDMTALLNDGSLSEFVPAEEFFTKLQNPSLHNYRRIAE